MRILSTLDKKHEQTEVPDADVTINNHASLPETTSVTHTTTKPANFFKMSKDAIINTAHNAVTLSSVCWLLIIGIIIFVFIIIQAAEIVRTNCNKNSFFGISLNDTRTRLIRKITTATTGTMMLLSVLACEIAFTNGMNQYYLPFIYAGVIYNILVMGYTLLTVMNHMGTNIGGILKDRPTVKVIGIGVGETLMAIATIFLGHFTSSPGFIVFLIYFGEIILRSIFLVICYRFMFKVIKKEDDRIKYQMCSQPQTGDSSVVSESPYNIRFRTK